MKILFWNTHGNENINNIVADLIIENNASIVVLAEHKADMQELINILSSQNIEMNQYPSIGCERIKILGCVANVQQGLQRNHVSMQIINDDIILCCIHLSSQIYAGNEEQREIHIEQIVNDVKELENELNTENTIIVGDFNVNPYESECLNARYFHGIPVYEESKRKVRTISDREFSMFYNPMWNFLGDFKQPYGTYYYAGNKAINPYWNIYDQVILRPSLKDRFVDNSLKIITETKTKYFLNTKGHPDKNISDHLPIIFEIKEN